VKIVKSENPVEAIRILRRVRGGGSGWGWQMLQGRGKREVDEEGRRAEHYLVDIIGRNMRVAP
jgi:hypothetical protein